MPNQKNKSPQTDQPVYVKYFGLAFQMLAIIGLGTYFGYWLDLKNDINFPIWLLVCCFASIGIAFYQLFKSIQSDGKQ